MAKYFCLSILIALILIFLPKNLQADSNIVINEFLANPKGTEAEEEWVELYNKGLEDIDVKDWSLCDAGNHVLPIYSENTEGLTIIKSKDWLAVFRKGSSFSLNNSGDETISLYNSADCSGTVLDSVSYSGADEEKTWGRVPDGSGDFQKNLEKSKGGANIAPEPSPEPQSESTNEENKSESSNKSPSPTTATKSIATKPTQVSKSPAPVLGKKTQSSPGLLSSPSLSPSPTPVQNQEESNGVPSSKIKIAGILTGSGAILAGAAIAFYLWYYKVKGKKASGAEESEIEDGL